MSDQRVSLEGKNSPAFQGRRHYVAMHPLNPWCPTVRSLVQGRVRVTLGLPDKTFEHEH